jgi:hypothetical protein
LGLLKKCIEQETKNKLCVVWNCTYGRNNKAKK